MQPHAPELEEAVIGACLIEQEALPLIADKLRPEMFYDDHHQLIFAALMAMYHAGKKIDILTVKEELARRGNLDAIGGPYAIVQLSSKVASSAHIEYHAQIIHQKYLAREMVVGFNKLLTCAMDETIDIVDTLIDAHNLLDRLEGESGHNAHIRDMETLMADTMEEAERRIAKSVNGVTGIPTGLTELDGQLLYVQPDGSLFFFSRGVNRCGDTLYYQTGEDGYALLPPPAGLYDDGQALYDVQPDGSLLTGSADGHLTFGADGRYTSGSVELDTGIAQLLSDSNPDALDARETRLSMAFDYIRDHFKYLSMPHYEAGTDDWAQEAAEVFLQQGKGNCYCFAAAFMYCARRLGYQAYVVAGHESKPDNDHAWTMIEENGETRLYDVQLEYAYLYQFGKGEIDAYAMTDSGGSVYNGFQYYFP